jgi:hypothetical protein
MSPHLDSLPAEGSFARRILTIPKACLSITGELLLLGGLPGDRLTLQGLRSASVGFLTSFAGQVLKPHLLATCQTFGSAASEVGGAVNTATSLWQLPTKSGTAKTRSCQHLWIL